MNTRVAKEKGRTADICKELAKGNDTNVYKCLNKSVVTLPRPNHIIASYIIQNSISANSS